MPCMIKKTINLIQSNLILVLFYKAGPWLKKKNYILQKQLALTSHWLQFHMPGKAFQVNITKMSNVKFLPYTLVLHCLPWTLSVSVKLIKLHENSWKGKELDHIEYLYKPLLNINTCNRQVMMSQKLNWLNYGIGWHIQVFCHLYGPTGWSTVWVNGT